MIEFIREIKTMDNNTRFFFGLFAIIIVYIIGSVIVDVAKSIGRKK